jgi:excisionase family DNA binding protein
MQPIFIRAEQAADLLTVTRRHVYELIANGEITSIKYGRRRLIDVQSLYDFRDRLLAQAK